MHMLLHLHHIIYIIFNHLNQ